MINLFNNVWADFSWLKKMTNDWSTYHTYLLLLTYSCWITSTEGYNSSMKYDHPIYSSTPS